MFTIALASLLFVTLSQNNAYALTRSEVIDRAKAWTNSRVPYSQSRTFRGYRADCSGFVSYALALKKPGYTTVALAKTFKPVQKGNLKPGDVIVASGVHAVMFGGWANAERTKYVAYEQSASAGSVRRVTPYPYWKGSGSYAAKKHPNIRDIGSVSGGGSSSTSTLRGRLIRKQSDFNGDGLSDLMFLYDGPANKRSLWHFYSDRARFNPVNVWTGNTGAFDANSAKMTAGDFNGNGLTDTAFLYKNPDDSSSIWIFYSNRNRTVKSVKAWTSAPGGFGWDRMKLTAGDFNGDGRDDLAFFHGANEGRSTIWMFLSNKDGSFTPKKWWQGEIGAFDWDRAEMTSADYNGDGRSDLAFLYNYANSPSTLWVFATKKDGGFLPAVWWRANPGTFGAERMKMASGYFNSDNYADIAVLYNEQPNSRSSIAIFSSNGIRSFSPRRAWLSEPGAFKWERAKMVSGDFNGNGISDLAVLYGYESGQAVAWMFENNSANGLTPRKWWTGIAGNYDWERVMAVDQRIIAEQ